MRLIDRILQSWRIQRVLRYLPESARVIDIGAHQGELFKVLGKRLEQGFGVDPLVASRIVASQFIIEKGFFPA